MDGATGPKCDFMQYRHHLTDSSHCIEPRTAVQYMTTVAHEVYLRWLHSPLTSLCVCVF